MILVRQPNYYCTNKGTCELCEEVGAEKGRVEVAEHGKRNGDCGVDVSASAKGIGCIHTNEYGHCPPKGDNDPATVLTFGFVKHNICYYAGTEHEQQGGAKEFAEEGLHIYLFMVEELY